MTDLSTSYLGLELRNPLVPSSSPLTGHLDSCRRLEDAGAAALVLPSLFEEAILEDERISARFLHEQETGFGEADSFLPVPEDYPSALDEYLSHLQAAKAALDIPVIASLNGISTEGWVSYGQQLQQAGADALELNVYYVAADPEESSVEVEQRYLDILAQLREQVQLPVTMKLSPQFSSPAHFARRLQAAGARGVSLFNRFYQPDIDLETREVIPTLSLSTPYESLLRIHWLAILHGRVQLSLAATGGFHETADVLKALMAGADVVHLCSLLLRNGPEALTPLLEDLKRWLEEHEYQSVQQLKGSVSQQHAIDPAAWERTNYVKLLGSHRSPDSVWR